MPKSTGQRFHGVAERLEKRRFVIDSGCWIWQGTATPSGYGQISIKKKRRHVHVVAYEMYVGEVPHGYQVDHVKTRGCISKLCFNPDHLEAVTQRENIARSGVAWAHFNRGVCKNGGHVLTEENIYVSPHGHRSCKDCQREWQRANRRAKREARDRQD